MAYLEQQQCDADDCVVTSAPPLALTGASLDDTWTGDEDASEIDVLRRRNAFLERAAENLREQLRLERARASACVRGGLDAVPLPELFAAVERRGFQRPVPASAVVVARDDGCDNAAQDAS